jgi:SAM-dependent methyltransferase
MRNTYSPRWFSTFLGSIDADVVAYEVAFLSRQLPVGRFPRVLDVCSGPGRHQVPLCALGYDVIGLDRDMGALTTSRGRGREQAITDMVLVRGDMAALPVARDQLDAAICMWQSFGHLEAQANRLVLAQMHDAVRDGGRVVLDVYNRRFHESRTGMRTLQRGDAMVFEERTMRNGRLRVRLSYDTPADVAHIDEFEWTLYDESELSALAAEVGLSTVLVCTAFDESRAVTAEDARMQLVFER